jgi:PKD repeat protein
VKRKIIWILLAIILLAPYVATANADSSSERRVLILYKSDITPANLDDVQKVAKLIKNKISLIRAIVATVNENDIPKIASDGDVLGVYEDIPVSITLTQSVPKIGADKVHTTGVTGSGVRVCIVDTGVDDSHPALSPLVAEKDFVNDDNNAMDDHGHGTHVAGIVASKDPTVKGVAPGVSLMAAKVMDSKGTGWSSDVISGIEWCVNNGADVINMSLGGGSYATACDNEPLAKAANTAVDRGVVVVAASGNNGYANALVSPACGSKVISVGAVWKDDSWATFSNGGIILDVVAPGVSIRSTHLLGSFKYLSGTSMASPHVAGVSALLLAANPSLTPSDVDTILKTTAVDLGTAGFDTTFGYGRVDAYSAYLAASGSESPPAENAAPTAHAGGPYSGIEGNSITLDASASADPDGIIASYSWNFGDGKTGSGVKPSHVYTENGVYSVTLTVTDNNGAQSSASTTVSVDNVPPSVNAGLDKNGIVGESLIFSGFYTDPGSVDTHTLQWSFGDGSTSSSITSTHAYTSAGQYTVSLTVTDDDGASGTDTLLVTITDGTGGSSDGGSGSFPPTAPSGVIFFDDFNNGFGKWTESNEFDWNVERPAERSVPGITSGNMVAHGDACSTSKGCILTMKNSIDLSSYQSATLKFWRYVDRSLDAGEFLKVEVYNGSTWQTVFYWTNGSGDDDTWHEETLDLSNYLVSNFSVRFTTKENSAYEEAEIDNVTIEAVGVGSSADPPDNTSPLADAGPDRTVNKGVAVTFDGSSSFDPDGTVVSYSWNLGNGDTANGSVTSYAYASAGTYTVTLTVTDDDGASGTDTLQIIVNDPDSSSPPPPSNTLFSDGFESGLGKWTQSNGYYWNVEGPTEKNIPGFPSSNMVAHADSCYASAGCILTMKSPIDLSSYQSATMKFWRYVDTSLDEGEFLKVEVYNGSTWQTVFYWTNGSGDDDTWHEETLDLSNYLASNFSVRFVTKESAAYEEVEIDNLTIEASVRG